MIDDTLNSLLNILKVLFFITLVLLYLKINWPASMPKLNITTDNVDIVDWMPVDRETKEITMGKDTFEILIKTYMRKVKVCKCCNQAIENK